MKKWIKRGKLKAYISTMIRKNKSHKLKMIVLFSIGWKSRKAKVEPVFIRLSNWFQKWNFGVEFIFIHYCTIHKLFQYKADFSIHRISLFCNDQCCLGRSKHIANDSPKPPYNSLLAALTVPSAFSREFYSRIFSEDKMVQVHAPMRI